MASLAFVGQREYFEQCSLERPTGGVEPVFLDFKPGGPVAPLLQALDALAPDVVLVFRPDLMPSGALAGVPGVIVGYLTEPLPRPGGRYHPDLDSRMRNLRQLDTANFDRIVSFDPLVAATVAEVAPVWRSLPIPVADRLYAPPRRASGPPRVLFVGHSTAHRESFLGAIKRDFDCVHLAHGIGGDRLIEFMGEADIGINLHNEPYPSFENRVSLYLAAGLLVLSEPLSPRHGLLPGTDYVEAAQPSLMWELVLRIARTPDAFATVRWAGHRRAQRFRASRVYPALVRDALADVALWGSPRRAAAPRRPVRSAARSAHRSPSTRG
jgi:hypothetical protein